MDGDGRLGQLRPPALEEHAESAVLETREAAAGLTFLKPRCPFQRLSFRRASGLFDLVAPAAHDGLVEVDPGLLGIIGQVDVAH
jgi:hypothetical protein